MKLFLYRKICHALLVGMIGLSLNTTLSALWRPSLSIDAKQAAEVLDQVCEKQIDHAGETGTKLANTTLAKVTEFVDKRYPELKNDIIKGIDYGANEMRLAPVYVVGTTLLIASINMYWQALNDYLNTTETSAEATQALRKKIFGKIKAGLVFSAVGVGTLYKSHAIAALCLGYLPKQDMTTAYIPMTELYS